MKMKRMISDPDVRLLASIAGLLRADYVDFEKEGLWRESPFAWISTAPARQVCKIGEQLIAGWFAAKGLDVTRSGDSEADRVIAGRRMEIRCSLLLKNGVYTFQQIRDQDYDYAICLGVSPFEAQCWVISKDVLRKHVFRHTSQDRGRLGTDAFWLSFQANDPPDWLKSCGGSLSEAFVVLKS